MALGTYTLKARGKASSFDPRTNHGKPLIVVPREFRQNFTTPRFPTPKDVVIVDVVDLLADTVLISVIWGGGAMVDAIKQHVPAEGQEPTKLPVMIQPATSANGGTYYVLVPLDGQMLALAQAWDAKYPTRVEQERVNHEAQQATNPGGFSTIGAPGVAPVDPMAAALAALQGVGPQSTPQQVTQAANTVHAGIQAQNDQAAQVAALQAQLAALTAQNGGLPNLAAPAQTAQPVAQAPQAAPQPAMSDADLEAAIQALG